MKPMLKHILFIFTYLHYFQSQCVDADEFMKFNEQKFKVQNSFIRPSLSSICSGSQLGRGAYGQTFPTIIKQKGGETDIACKIQKLDQRKFDKMIFGELQFAQNFDYLKTFPKVIGCAFKQNQNDYSLYIFMDKLHTDLNKIEGMNYFHQKNPSKLKRYKQYLQMFLDMKEYHQLFVHQDIKLANIMQDKRGNLFFIDFGLGVNIKHLKGNENLWGTTTCLPPEKTLANYLFIKENIQIKYQSVYIPVGQEQKIYNKYLQSLNRKDFNYPQNMYDVNAIKSSDVYGLSLVLYQIENKMTKDDQRFSPFHTCSKNVAIMTKECFQKLQNLINQVQDVNFKNFLNFGLNADYEQRTIDNVILSLQQAISAESNKRVLNRVIEENETPLQIEVQLYQKLFLFYSYQFSYFFKELNN